MPMADPYLETEPMAQPEVVPSPAATAVLTQEQLMQFEDDEEKRKMLYGDGYDQPPQDLLV